MAYEVNLGIKCRFETLIWVKAHTLFLILRPILNSLAVTEQSKGPTITEAAIGRKCSTLSSISNFTKSGLL